MGSVLSVRNLNDLIPNQYHDKTFKEIAQTKFPLWAAFEQKQKICKHSSMWTPRVGCMRTHVCVWKCSLLFWYLKLSHHIDGYYGSTGWGTSNRNSKKKYIEIQITIHKVPLKKGRNSLKFITNDTFSSFSILHLPTENIWYGKPWQSHAGLRRSFTVALFLH